MIGAGTSPSCGIKLKTPFSKIEYHIVIQKPLVKLFSNYYITAARQYRYKASSKCDCVLQKWKTKEDAIWSAVKADHSFGNHPTWDQTSVGIMAQSMKTSMDNEWDIVPAGRKKFIHYIAAACKFTLSVTNSPFTGVFKNGVQHGLLRMGSATWVDPFPLHGCVPGVSIKFFRSYR